MNPRILSALILLSLFSCQDGGVQKPTLFELIPQEQSGIEFNNELSYDEDFNIFTYRNFYNGGGVALGDINNDGLLDIYLSSNLEGNKLYLNQGDFKFKDITSEAGVKGNRAWSTGVVMVDINGDNYLDIYVCNSGDIAGDNKKNELFINQGDGTFSEEAEKYGLADQGYSTHAVFFDYDKDGDLDVYLLNNSYQAIGSFNKMQNERPVRDAVGGDKLFKNENGKFFDVSEEAGIFGSIIGFGLGVSVGDVNQDSWPDIFISNDFFERDYLYLNNQDGTFTESLEQSMRSISASSMGADLADINGDGLLDIFVSDMLPNSPQRLKQVTSFENWDKFQFNKSHGYHYQFSRNMLHINNGDGTFSELGRFANVEATDWSWGGLIFDMDNDGKRDLFVANGIYQDITDLDYLNFINDDATKSKIISQNGIEYKSLIDPIPINPVPNFAFKNLGDLAFENIADEWGFGSPSHSNGAAYGDLNNDGTLDLVINNVNKPVSIFKNNTHQFFPENHSIQLKLEGKGMNTEAIGTQIKLIVGDQTFYAEQMPNRGFESSVDPKITFGLGEIYTIDKIQISWPDGGLSTIENVPVDTLINLSWEDALPLAEGEPFFNQKPSKVFQKVSSKKIDFRHQENPYVDFDRDRLTYHMFSTEGPAYARADVNGDGLEDLYFGGAKTFSGKLYLQHRNGEFHLSRQEAFETDSLSEDTDALFFDANGDSFPDLFVSSGGNESAPMSPELADRIYFNDGKGNFQKNQNAGLGKVLTSSSVLKTLDLNGDGALDVFVGGRQVPFNYGSPASSTLWINEGNGNFTDQTQKLAPELNEIGMITDAEILDYDQDGSEDLVLVGEWMAPTFFRNTNGKFELFEMSELGNLKGWYRTLTIGDFNEDGKPDLVLGNHGLNTRFKTDSSHPISMYLNDFDQNGSIEHIFTRQEGEVQVPYTLKHELEKQIPEIRKEYMRYINYNNEMLSDLFPQEIVDQSIQNQVNQLASGILINRGNGKFDWSALPRMAQKSWVFAIQVLDINQDDHLDLILGGNLFEAKPEVGKYDASFGEVLLGNGDGTFTYWPNSQHGLHIDGNVRAFDIINEGELFVVKNNAPAELWKWDIKQ